MPNRLKVSLNHSEVELVFLTISKRNADMHEIISTDTHSFITTSRQAPHCQLTMITGIDFELVRILLAAGMLGSASFFDIRRREVSDMLWVFFGITALAVYALEFAYGGAFDLLNTSVPILIAAVVSFGIYKSGLFGGADALALTTLAAILPTFSGGIAERVLLPAGSAFLVHPIAPLIVLSNAVILSLSLIGFNLASNAAYASKNPGKLFEGLEHESTGKKILAVTVGYKTGSKPGYAFPIEQLVDGRRQFSFALKNAETTEYETRRDVWVTRGTPFLAFMLAGFVSMLFVGDIAAIIMRLLF
ncbi:A24 family peptidase C-terminal domain-containing protein [Candidatus Nitrososphaera gargensis]|uniref:A24 family peptidase C-terminal domain-containing protein n=1 Tax=Candidatus Nitrososphaera gargensis TaxID=497727 RepID=UPI0011E52B05|nr:A24 family peptidase C-terminal domain-containing protein [Candidatus Nitrososphaera gargensis]